MQLIRPCSWEEVFLSWYQNEGENPNWIKLAQERGFASWADWRINGYAKRFDCANAEWGIYEIENSSEAIASWYGGPFRTWIERFYDGAITKTLAELADHPGILEHKGVRSISESYPRETMITALELSDGRMMVIEGMHRACALALMRKEGRPFEGTLKFLIGKSSLSTLPPAGENTDV